MMTADERIALIRLKIERADKHIDSLKPILETLVQFRDRINSIVEAFRPYLD
jgi:hypothetical protein